MTDDLWKKYRLEGGEATARGLYFDGYSHEEMRSYINMVAIAHDFVASWWEAHPEDRCLPYYDTLKKASPEWDAKILAWSQEHTRRMSKRRKVENNGTVQYSPTDDPFRPRPLGADGLPTDSERH